MESSLTSSQLTSSTRMKPEPSWSGLITKHVLSKSSFSFKLQPTTVCSKLQMLFTSFTFILDVFLAIPNPSVVVPDWGGAVLSPDG